MQQAPDPAVALLLQKFLLLQLLLLLLAREQWRWRSLPRRRVGKKLVFVIYLARPSSQARAGTGEYSFSLFS